MFPLASLFPPLRWWYNPRNGFSPPRSAVVEAQTWRPLHRAPLVRPRRCSPTTWWLWVRQSAPHVPGAGFLFSGSPLSIGTLPDGRPQSRRGNSLQFFLARLCHTTPGCQTQCRHWGATSGPGPTETLLASPSPGRGDTPEDEGLRKAVGLPSSTPSIPELGELGWHFRIWLHPYIPLGRISHRNHFVLA